MPPPKTYSEEQVDDFECEGAKMHHRHCNQHHCGNVAPILIRVSSTYKKGICFQMEMGVALSPITLLILSQGIMGIRLGIMGIIHLGILMKELKVAH